MTLKKNAAKMQLNLYLSNNNFNIRKMTTEQKISKWNNLTATQKSEFGDRMITHDTNLQAWQKDFNDLSESKKQKILNNIENASMPGTLIGTGI